MSFKCKLFFMEMSGEYDDESVFFGKFIMKCLKFEIVFENMFDDVVEELKFIVLIFFIKRLYFGR